VDLHRPGANVKSNVNIEQLGQPFDAVSKPGTIDYYT
jgi:hypothetical protein